MLNSILEEVIILDSLWGGPILIVLLPASIRFYIWFVLFIWGLDSYWCLFLFCYPIRSWYYWGYLLDLLCGWCPGWFHSLRSLNGLSRRVKQRWDNYIWSWDLMVFVFNLGVDYSWWDWRMKQYFVYLKKMVLSFGDLIYYWADGVIYWWFSIVEPVIGADIGDLGGIPLLF